MRRPGRGDTLIKIASLGGGGIAIGGNLQKTANSIDKNKKKLQKLKDSEGEWKKFVADNERKKEKIKELDKKVAKKKLEKAKKKCPKCGGSGCSHCKGRGYHGK